MEIVDRAAVSSQTQDRSSKSSTRARRFAREVGYDRETDYCTTQVFSTSINYSSKSDSRAASSK
jgi:hypothetical protein